MKKHAIIFHGTDCKPTDFWYPSLALQLTRRGYEVEIPSYPDINRVPLKTFLPTVLKSHRFDEQTVIIGHSAGGPLILSLLEHIDTVLLQALLVAGFSRPLPEGSDPILQETYDWSKIKAHCSDFVFINSVDDPWGCNDEQGRRMFTQLGGTLVIRRDGHFGSTLMKQPYKHFPLLDRLIQ